MFNRIFTGFAVLMAITFSTGANATVINATLTVDNHFGLFVGDNSATNLTFIGRDSASWTTTDSFSFNANNGDRLFVYAWDYGGPQSFIGQFSGWNGTLLTNQQDWQWTLLSTSESIPGSAGSPPSSVNLQSLLSGAQWNNVLWSAPNGSGPWGTFGNIASNADYIWGDDKNSSSAVVVFRSTQLQANDVPEPAPLALLFVGLFGLGLARKYRK